MFGSVKKIISAFETRRQTRPVSLPPLLPPSLNSSSLLLLSPLSLFSSAGVISEGLYLCVTLLKGCQQPVSGKSRASTLQIKRDQWRPCINMSLEKREDASEPLSHIQRCSHT